jgi:hypothetical protein
LRQKHPILQSGQRKPRPGRELPVLRKSYSDGPCFRCLLWAGANTVGGSWICFAGVVTYQPSQPNLRAGCPPLNGFWPLPCRVLLAGPYATWTRAHTFFIVLAPPILMLISHHPLNPNSMGLAKTNTTWKEIHVVTLGQEQKIPGLNYRIWTV